MRTITITTRTLPPTNTKAKRVHVQTNEGLVAEYPWDWRYDAPEVHENAAIQVAQIGDPMAKIEITRTGSTAMGYTFRAAIH